MNPILDKNPLFKEILNNKSVKHKCDNNCQSIKRDFSSIDPDTQVGDYSKLQSDISKNNVDTIEIKYSQGELPTATVALKDKKIYKTEILPDIKEFQSLLDKKEIPHEFKNKKASFADNLIGFAKLVFEEGMAPLLSLALMGGAFLASKNIIDKVSTHFNYSKAVQPAGDIVYSEDKVSKIQKQIKTFPERIPEYMNDAKQEIELYKNKIFSARDLLLNHRTLEPDSKIILMEGPPATGKTFLSKVFMTLGHKKEKDLGILRMNLDADNTDTIVKMLGDLKNSKNSSSIFNLMDKAFKKVGGKKPVEVLQLMADEITLPHFIALQDQNIMKDIIQDNLVIKVMKKTKATYAAMAGVAAAGIAGLTLFVKNEKKKSKEKGQDFLTFANFSKIIGITALTAGGIYGASKLFNKEVFRKLKILLFATGNEIPRSWDLDNTASAMARRVMHIKFKHQDPDVIAEGLAKKLKSDYFKGLIKESSDEILDIGKILLQDKQYGKTLNHATFDSNSAFTSNLKRILEDSKGKNTLSESIKKTLDCILHGKNIHVGELDF